MEVCDDLLRAPNLDDLCERMVTQLDLIQSPDRALWKKTSEFDGSKCFLCEDRSQERWLSKCTTSGCSCWAHLTCAKLADGYGVRGREHLIDDTDTRGHPTISFICPSHNLAALYCSCRKPDSVEDQYIECNVCCEWYHYTCENLDVEEPSPQKYVCRACEKRGGTAPAEIREQNQLKSDIYYSEILAKNIIRASEWMENVRYFLLDASKEVNMGDSLVCAQSLLNEGMEFKFLEAGEDSIDEEDEDGEALPLVVSGMHDIFKAQLYELDSVLKATRDWQENFETWQVDHAASFWAPDGAGNGHWMITELELEAEEKNLEVFRLTSLELKIPPPSSLWLDNAIKAVKWSREAYRLLNGPPFPSPDDLITLLNTGEMMEVGTAFSQRAYFILEHLQFILKSVTSWQNRARQMIKLSTPIKGGSVNIRIDQFRYLLMHSPDVRVHIPEHTMATDIVQFWQNWEKEAEEAVKVPIGKSSLFQALVDQELGLSIQNKVSELLNSAGAYPHQIRFSTRDTLAKVPGLYSWITKAKNMLGQLDLAIGDLKRTDFSELFDFIAATAGYNAIADEPLVVKIREAAQGGLAAARARNLLDSESPDRWNMDAVVRAIQEIEKSPLKSPDEMKALVARMEAIRWCNDVAPLLSDDVDRGPKTVSLAILQSYRDRVDSTPSLDDEMDDVPLFMKLVSRLKMAKKWRARAAKIISYVSTVEKLRGSERDPSTSQAIQEVHACLTELQELRISELPEEENLVSIINQCNEWITKASSIFSSTEKVCASKEDLNELLKEGYVTLVPSILLETIEWYIKANEVIQRNDIEAIQQTGKEGVAFLGPILGSNIDAIVRSAVISMQGTLEKKLLKLQVLHSWDKTGGLMPLSVAQNIVNNINQLTDIDTDLQEFKESILAKAEAEAKAMKFLSVEFILPSGDEASVEIVENLKISIENIRDALTELKNAHPGITSDLESRCEDIIKLLEWCVKSQSLCGPVVPGQELVPLHEVTSIIQEGLEYTETNALNLSEKNVSAIKALTNSANKIEDLAKVWSEKAKKVSMPFIPESPMTAIDIETLSDEPITIKDLESLLRHPILSRVGAAQQVAMICQAVQGASSWEKEAYELLQNEDTTTIELEQHLRKGGSLLLPAGLGAWAITKWAYDCRSTAAEIIISLTEVRGRIPYYTLANSVRIFEVILWPPIVQNPSPLLKRAMKTWPDPAPPSCAAESVNNLNMILSRFREAESVVNETSDNLDKILMSGSEAISEALQRIDKISGMDMSEVFVDSLRAADSSRNMMMDEVISIDSDDEKSLSEIRVSAKDKTKKDELTPGSQRPPLISHLPPARIKTPTLKGMKDVPGRIRPQLPSPKQLKEVGSTFRGKLAPPPLKSPASRTSSTSSSTAVKSPIMKSAKRPIGKFPQGPTSTLQLQLPTVNTVVKRSGPMICLIDSCSKLARANSAYCSEKCAELSGPAALREILAHKLNLSIGWIKDGKAKILSEKQVQDVIATARKAVADPRKRIKDKPSIEQDKLYDDADLALERLRSPEGKEKFYATRQKVRDGFADIFMDGLKYFRWKPSLAKCRILAGELENEIQKYSLMQKGGDIEARDHYKTKHSMLKFNLVVTKNPELFMKVLSGHVNMEELCSMNAQQLAPKEQQQLRQKMLVESMSDHWVKEKDESGFVWDNQSGGLMHTQKLKEESRAPSLPSILALKPEELPMTSKISIEAKRIDSTDSLLSGTSLSRQSSFEKIVTPKNSGNQKAPIVINSQGVSKFMEQREKELELERAKELQEAREYEVLIGKKSPRASSAPSSTPAFTSTLPALPSKSVVPEDIAFNVYDPTFRLRFIMTTDVSQNKEKILRLVPTEWEVKGRMSVSQVLNYVESHQEGNRIKTTIYLKGGIKGTDNYESYKLFCQNYGTFKDGRVGYIQWKAQGIDIIIIPPLLSNNFLKLCIPSPQFVTAVIYYRPPDSEAKES